MGIAGVFTDFTFYLYFCFGNLKIRILSEFFTPVLFIVFNRPEITKESLKILKRNRPRKIYISQDGPRKNNPNDFILCKKVRKIIEKEIDWNCEVYTNFQDKNLGCKDGVLSAINWFFKNEEMGIILEDDIIVDDSFFNFSSEMLVKYEKNESVVAIQGFNQFGQNIKSNDYFFSRGFYPWGWATWRTKWKLYDKNIKSSDLIGCPKIFPKTMKKAISFNLDLIHHNLLDTWDTQFIAMLVKNNYFTVTPYANLSTNIGVDGAHSSNNHKILEFKFGYVIDSKFLQIKKVKDDIQMNKLLWKEYDDFKYTIKIKSLLLKLGLYPLIKKLYKLFF
jgi:hypothetical protein